MNESREMDALMSKIRTNAISSFVEKLVDRCNVHRTKLSGPEIVMIFESYLKKEE